MSFFLTIIVALLTSPNMTLTAADSKQLPQSTKLLAQRDDYTTCHISLPDEPQRLPAIALDGNFYSFFRSLQDAAKTLNLLRKLSANGEQTVMTPNKRGYAIWVHESDAVLATNRGSKARNLPPSFGPANSWIVSADQSGYNTCSLKVPDLPDMVRGLANGQRLFSLYRQESDPKTALSLGSRLSQRGDEIVILVGDASYAIYVYEPSAIVVRA